MDDKGFFLPDPPENPGFRHTGEVVDWRVARQIATWVARQHNLDSGVRSEESLLPDFVELFRVAEMRLEDMFPAPTGMATFASPTVTDRVGWAAKSVDEFRFCLESIGKHLSSSAKYESPELDTPVAAMVAPLMPVLLGGQLGLMLGNMAEWVMKGFDVLLPRTSSPRPLVVGQAIAEMASGFSLPAADVALWASIEEFAHLRQFQVPWVRKFLAEEVEKAISKVVINPEGVAEKLSSIDPSDPASLESFAEDPSGLLMALLVPPDPEECGPLRAAAAVMQASAEHAAAVASMSLLEEPDRTREVLRRHRVERNPAETALIRLCGLDISGREHSAALAFCQVVVSEAGNSAIRDLWRSPASLPTWEEIADPLSWIARVRKGD